MHTFEDHSVNTLQSEKLDKWVIIGSRIGKYYDTNKDHCN